MSIDDFVANLEAGDDAEGLADARRWVAAEFYARDKGLTLAGLRLRAGLTQKMLASAINTHQSDIARMEAGNHAPNSKRAVALAEALKATDQEVMTAIKLTRAERDGQA